MRNLTDQELFGMIPKKDGGHDPGNADDRLSSSLKTAYERALMSPGTFLNHLHSSASGSTASVAKKRLKERVKEDTRTAYEIAFPKVDNAVEAHMEKTNGYIFAFPPVETKIYKTTADDFNDWKKPIDKFNYFKHAPDEYIPATETKLRTAYANLHSPNLKSFYWRIFWFLMAAAGLVLAFLGGSIYTIFPELYTWAFKDSKNFCIHMGIIIVYMLIIGWFVPAKRLKLTFDNHTPLFLFMLGSIFTWSVGYFLITASMELESDGNALVNIICHIVKWPYVVYFVVVFVFHLVHLCKAIPDALRYFKTLSDLRRDYVETYEAEIHKLQRYLRLRELWLEWERISMPNWLSAFESRKKTYDKEYQKLKK